MTFRAFFSSLLGSGGGCCGCEKVLWLILGAGGLLFALDFKFWLVLIELHKLGEIELGLLEKLDLSDEDIL